MYAPVINELGPRLIASGYEGEAAARMQGAQDVGNNIMSAASAVGGGIGKHILTQQEIAELGGKVQAWHDARMISDDDVAKFNEANLGKKRGMVGEWGATANLIRAKELDTFRTGNQMRQDSNMASAQSANRMAAAQLTSGAKPPKYDRVTLADGTVAFVAPNAPTQYPTDGQGKRMKAQQNQNPLAAFLNGGAPEGADPAASAPAAPSGRQAVGGYQIGRKYSGMTYLGGDPNDATSWQQ